MQPEVFKIATVPLDIRVNPAKTLLKWRVVLFVVTAVAVGLWFLSVLQDLYAFRSGTWQPQGRIWLLDVDVEVSVFTWVSILAFYSVAIVLAYIGLCLDTARPRNRAFWIGLSLVFLALSLDEHSGIHEKLSGLIAAYVQGSGLLHFAWAAPAGILSLLGLAAVVPFIRALPGRVFALMLVSALVFLCGAVVLEMIGGAIAESAGIASRAYRVATNLEEMAELGGLLLFMYALMLFIETASPAGRGPGTRSAADPGNQGSGGADGAPASRANSAS
jgi:hypothetical protein